MKRIPRKSNAAHPATTRSDAVKDVGKTGLRDSSQLFVTSFLLDCPEGVGAGRDPVDDNIRSRDTLSQFQDLPLTTTSGTAVPLAAPFPSQYRQVLSFWFLAPCGGANQNICHPERSAPGAESKDPPK